MKHFKRFLLFIFAFWPICFLTGSIILIGTYISANILNGNAFNINYVTITIDTANYLYQYIWIPIKLYFENINPIFWLLIAGLSLIFFTVWLIRWIPFMFHFIKNMIFEFLKLYLKVVLNLISKSLFCNDRKLLITKTYLEWLYKYSKMNHFWYIWKTHKMFFTHIFKNSLVLPQWEFNDLLTPFEYKSIFMWLQEILSKHVSKWVTLSKNFQLFDGCWWLQISKWSFTWENLKNKILDIKEEILMIFPEEYDLYIHTESIEYITLNFIKRNLWVNKTLNFQSIHLDKNQILMWFYPSIKKDSWICYENYVLETQKLVHSFVVWASRSWKDVFMLNFIFWVLYNIHHYNNIELYFFDTKQSDAEYLKNLEPYGIFRYPDLNEYIDILTKLEDEITQRQQLVWISSNIQNFNKTHPHNPMKEKIIVINELLSLFTSLEKEEVIKMGNILNNLLSKWASVWIKLILISQSLRKDTDSSVWKLLANIQAKFILKMNNKDEVDIASRWLSLEENKRISSMKKYNTFYTEDSQIVQEFKGYNLTQVELKKWIWENFVYEIHFEDENTNRYYEYAKKSNTISLRTAMNHPYNLSKDKWNSFIQALISKWEIEKNDGKNYTFK